MVGDFCRVDLDGEFFWEIGFFFLRKVYIGCGVGKNRVDIFFVYLNIFKI